MSKEKNIVAQNRKARHDYFIEDVFEAGIVLSGTEVKSLREGKASLVDSYADSQNSEIFLINCYIPEYTKANRFNHIPRRQRKLLLHRQQINKLIGKVKNKGYTLIPLSIYFDKRNFAKIELGLAKGKAKYDKRAEIKDREWKMEQKKIIKNTANSFSE